MALPIVALPASTSSAGSLFDVARACRRRDPFRPHAHEKGRLVGAVSASRWSGLEPGQDWVGRGCGIRDHAPGCFHGYVKCSVGLLGVVTNGKGSVYERDAFTRLVVAEASAPVDLGDEDHVETVGEIRLATGGGT